MPELPELDVVTEVLNRRVAGQTIIGVEILPPGGPIVVRDLTHSGFEKSLTGQQLESVSRRGKFLVFSIAEHPERSAAAVSGAWLRSRSTSRDAANANNAPFDYGAKNAPPLRTLESLLLVVNPKLTGRLQLAAPKDKRMQKTHVIISLSGGGQLRYVYQKQMGQLYLTRDVALALDFSGMGPEALEISLADFRARLKRFPGEIKGTLTRSHFVAGIGNAYADEILWAAQIHPYRKRASLTAEEIDRLYAAMQSTLREAIEKVRVEMGEDIHKKPLVTTASHR
ncbi:MAG: DNA-formamidopyrimidine glycosylase family protein [Anaerolineales bacterium]